MTMRSVMNGLSETTANSFTHSLDLPSLRGKLFPHIYVKITKFDIVNYPNPRWCNGLMIGKSLSNRTIAKTLTS